MLTRSRRYLPLVLLALAGILLGWTSRLETEIRSPFPLASTPRFHEALVRHPGPGEAALELAGVAVPRPLDLRRGETLGALLDGLGLTPRDARAAITAAGEHLDVRKIRPGEIGFAYFGSEGEIERLSLRKGNEGWVELASIDNEWRPSWRPLVRHVEERRVDGLLEDALESAIREAGGDPRLAFGMSQVLQWDLDFHRDLRRGDHFTVLYEDVSLDGEPAAPGEIHALVYENRGRAHEAYAWEGGYYDGEGRPLRKMFRRAPLPFSRVTSHFSRRRFHPVLKVNRPHWGVDYGAPVGTPVQVTADGVVTFAGTSGGAGKMVKVRHPNGYLTAYLHLSGFATRSGRKVRQGDVIGYVGSTGLATGPHLDYRVQRHGKWINPLSMESTPAEPIAVQEMPRFLEHRDALRRELGLASEDSRSHGDGELTTARSAMPPVAP